MSDREIITIQLGHYSNHVATHWWNYSQNSTHIPRQNNSSKNDSFGFESSSSSNSNNDKERLISKEVLWRVGEDSKGHETCVPRTVIVDERMNLGTLPQSGGPLYDEEVSLFNELHRLPDQFKECATIETWDENAMIECQNPKPYNEQQLAINHDKPPPTDISEETSKNMKWGDYSYTYYHPKSILIPTQDIAMVNSINPQAFNSLDGNQVDSSQNRSEEDINFSNWLHGRSLWQRTSFRDEFEDRIRFYSEECDWLEGFQILSDSAEFSGFAQLSNIVSHYFNDDYHKKVQLHFPISQFSSNFLMRRRFNPNLVPTVKDWLGMLGKSMIFYDLALSSSAADAITPLNDLSPSHLEAHPSNFYDKYSSNMHSSLYHSSAVVASYLETITTPYRNADLHKRIKASDIARSLTSSHQRMFLDSKLCFRNDQVLENFCSVSGLNIKSCMEDQSYTSIPIARGVSCSPDAYYSVTEKIYMTPDYRYNHFAPKMLKTKKAKSRSKDPGEVVYTDWCCSKTMGEEIRNLFQFTKKIPKHVLASLQVKYDLELDEINEAFIGFEDVLDNYERVKKPGEDSDSSDDEY